MFFLTQLIYIILDRYHPPLYTLIKGTRTCGLFIAPPLKMDQLFPLALSYDDVLLVPQSSQISSRADVDISTQITPHIKLRIPLISSNMDTVTGVDMAIALGKLGGLGVLPRFNSIAEQAQMVGETKKAGVIVAAAVGFKDLLDRSTALVKAGATALVIDVAHGHMQQTIQATSTLKKAFPKVDIIAGNVATYTGAHDLFTAGADCVKVGVGPGTACITRVQTGVGVPQITAVLEAARAAVEFKRTIICDGGTKNPGDIVKGLAAGSHAVMAGSQFAGTDEAPGEFIEIDGKPYKKYNGSASAEEKRKQLQRIGQEKIGSQYVDHVEGVSALVAYKGPVAVVVHHLLAGIRSGFSYAGAKNLDELHQKAQFVRISSQGVRESNFHDVMLSNS